MKTQSILCRYLPVAAAVLAVVVGSALQSALAQKKEIVWSADEKPIADQIHGLRGLADDVRAGRRRISR